MSAVLSDTEGSRGGAEEGAAVGWAKQSTHEGGAWAALLRTQEFPCLTSMINHGQR